MPESSNTTNNSSGTTSNSDHRASIENLSDFLSKMDSSIAVNKKASISLIKSSNIESEPHRNGANTSLNNTNTRLSDSSYLGEEEMTVAVRNGST